MGKLQRTRGAVYEREVCDVLTAKFGKKVTRKLGQARDGGDDIEVGPLRIECKRRRGIAVYEWLRQVQKAAKESDRLPLVVARADGQRSIAILDFEDFLALIPDDSEENSLARCKLETAPKAGRPPASRRPRADKVGGVDADLLKTSWPVTRAAVRAWTDGGFPRESAVDTETAAVGGPSDSVAVKG